MVDPGQDPRVEKVELYPYDRTSIPSIQTLLLKVCGRPQVRVVFPALSRLPAIFRLSTHLHQHNTSSQTPSVIQSDPNLHARERHSILDIPQALVNICPSESHRYRLSLLRTVALSALRPPISCLRVLLLQLRVGCQIQEACASTPAILTCFIIG